MNLLNAPPSPEATMSEHIQNQLCARIDELQLEKEVLSSNLDKSEEEIQRLKADNDALRREVANWRGA